MNQQQPNQTPPAQQPTQVPDSRFDEVMQKMKTLEAQNQQLRGQIDYMAKQAQPQGQQPQQPSPFKPEVQQAIEDIVKTRLESERTAFRQQIGMLYDQLDAVNYATKYSGDKFAKYQNKVEDLRKSYQAQNQYITREDALRMVYFEETGTKAQPAPAAAQAPEKAKPVFDPYFNTMVDPETGMPVQQAAAPAEGQPPAQWQQGQQWQAPPPAQAWQAQPQTQAAPMQAQPTGTSYPGQRTPPGANHPNGNAYGQAFQLPNQGVSPQAAPAHQASGGQRPNLSLDSSDADLAAFESQFGDIPL